MPQPTFDLVKLRAHLRHLPSGDLYLLLDRALGALAPEQVAQVLRDHVDVRRFQVDATPTPALLEQVHAFHAAAFRGDYYEDFAVNSRNCTQTSRGTDAFMAEYDRLLDLCLHAPRKDHERDLRTAFELLFDLLRQIDECRDDIVFFADEGGSWQVGVQWPQVFAAWCPCVAATAAPDQYVTAVEAVLRDFARHERPKLFELARQAATPEQRAALPVK
ncbi:MAG: hypothetical protein EXR79_08760 [Myxococcales bacterium]|nr:hypothetical protein [Myxococcales bacterium]